jgi:hypothetical protein
MVEGPGQSVVRVGQPGIVVAAVRGASEGGTGEMAEEISRRTGFGVVVGAGGDLERDVRKVSQGPLRFYVELHGNSRSESAGRIEIGTVGVDAEQAVKLRTLLELTRDAHLRARPTVRRLEVRVEPTAERGGVLRLPQRALHIELPRAARQEGRELYALILSDFLREAVTLPLPARR